MMERIALLKNRKGVTLVEVLVALAILSILAAAFLVLFSTSITNIFNFGAESRAVANTSERMEVLYNVDKLDGTKIEEELDILNGKHVVIKDNLYTYDSSSDFNYYYTDYNNGITYGYEVTMVAFYRNGEKHVELKSFIKEGE